MRHHQHQRKAASHIRSKQRRSLSIIAHLRRSRNASFARAARRAQLASVVNQSIARYYSPGA